MTYSSFLLISCLFFFLSFFLVRLDHSLRHIHFQVSTFRFEYRRKKKLKKKQWKKGSASSLSNETLDMGAIAFCDSIVCSPDMGTDPTDAAE